MQQSPTPLQSKEGDNHNEELKNKDFDRSNHTRAFISHHRGRQRINAADRQNAPQTESTRESKSTNRKHARLLLSALEHREVRPSNDPHRQTTPVRAPQIPRTEQHPQKDHADATDALGTKTRKCRAITGKTRAIDGGVDPIRRLRSTRSRSTNRLAENAADERRAEEIEEQERNREGNACRKREAGKRKKMEDGR